MMAETHADRIIGLLARKPCLDDDEIATELTIEPRQTVNQVCRRLAAHGKIVRERGSSGKIINRLNSELVRSHSDQDAAQNIVKNTQAHTTLLPGRSLIPSDFTKTLMIIPCSEHKERMGTADVGPSVIQSLPLPLAQELLMARRFVKKRSELTKERCCLLDTDMTASCTAPAEKHWMILRTSVPTSSS
jgi:hypothetical protein